MTQAQYKINHTFEKALKHWEFVAPILTYPKNKHDFERLVARLDKLLDIVGNDKEHPLNSLVDVLGNLVSSYEEDHFEKIKVKGIDALKYLMQSHDLNQSDLPEIASQGVLSEIINGKRSLNLVQIKKLAKRFHVDPSTFIEEE